MFSLPPPVQSFLASPVALLVLFLAASLLMIWRLNAMESKGFEGTILGTLIMPYCSGAANLIFAYVMSRSMAGGDGTAVNNGRLIIENCLLNNVTNLTLILGLAAIFCSTALRPGAGVADMKGGTGSGGTKAKARPPAKSQVQAQARKKTDAHRLYGLYRLDLLFTLIALFLFTGTLWALAKDGTIDFYDGLVLVALFLFWQVLHVFELLKNNVRKNRSFHWSIATDLLFIAACAYGIYLSVDHLVTWVGSGKSEIFSFAHLGWLSGALMVLPNAFLAMYYARRGRQDIVVSSQIGDSHICIPMCIGLFALSNPITIPEFFQTGIAIILGAGVVYFLLIAVLGRLERIMGFGFLGAYGVFLYQGVFG